MNLLVEICKTCLQFVITDPEIDGLQDKIIQ